MINDLTFRNELWVFVAPLIFILLDIASGFLNAWKEGDIRSSKLRDGLVKKAGEIFCIVIGEVAVYGLFLPKQIVYFISIYIIFMEIVSNIENISKMGVPIPHFLEDRLSKYTGDFQEGDYATVKKDIDAAWNEIRKLKEEEENGKSQ